MTNTQLAVVKKELGRGGALCKEFQRVRQNDSLDWRIEQGYALEQIAKSDKLQRCTPNTIGRSMIDLAFMGLSLSPAMKEAYLIPYGQECTASPSYMGLVNILARTGILAPPYVETNVVRKGDGWREWADPINGNMFEHSVADERGEVTHVWAVFTLSNGSKKVVTMDQKAIRGCRDAAARKNGGDIPFVWKGAFREEMYKKCVIRRGWKLLPKIRDPRVIAMLEAMERSDPMEFDDKSIPVNELKDAKLGPNEMSKLHDKMSEAGIPRESEAAFINGIASGLGFPSGVRTMPLDSFKELEAMLDKGLEQWKQRCTTSAQSDSVQEESTAPKEAA